MAGALLYYRLTSLQNLVMFRLRRLRQPKYLLFTAAAVAYIYFFVGRHFYGALSAGPPGFRGTNAAGAPAYLVPLTCAALGLAALLRIALTWGWPPELASFRFSEAEIAFLFPAPLRRRTLVHYRLLSNQAAILFTALIIAFVFTRGQNLAAHRVYRTIGWWIMISLLDLHVNGTRILLARLRERSAHFNLWRAAGVATVVAYAAAIGCAAYAALVGVTDGGDVLRVPPETLRLAVANSPAVFWTTLPFRIAFGPYASTNRADFLFALGPALVFLALHYYWVATSEISFEEGSIAQAEKRAAARAAAARGEGAPLGTFRPAAVSTPFPLAPTGVPEVAFLWKNLLSMRSGLFTRRALLVGGALLFGLVAGLRPLLLHGSVDPTELGQLILVFGAIVAGYTLFLGPQLARQDLRGDLANADLLKTYPIPGWRLALAELLAPALLLSLVLWLILATVAATYDPAHQHGWLTPLVRVTAVACLALAAPLVCLLQLLVPNTIMVLFPAWYQATRARTAGIEMFGQRLVFGLLQFLFMPLVLLPTAGWAILVYLGSFYWIGIAPALVLSFFVGAFLIGAAVAVGLWWLGGRFGRFDLSSELK